MGVLNVTPDSSPTAAVSRSGSGGHAGPRLAAEGADIIDIGAESTRPYGGAVAVSAEEERARLDPVLPAILALGVRFRSTR